jgi:hypothetical protein
MKIIILSLALVLSAVSCSKKESAATPPHFGLARGDLASPAEITTNKSGAHILYCVPIKLSSAKDAELHKFAQQHPNRQVEIVVGSKVITKVRMPANVTATSVLGLTVACDSIDEAKAIADSLDGLSY